MAKSIFIISIITAIFTLSSYAQKKASKIKTIDCYNIEQQRNTLQKKLSYVKMNYFLTKARKKLDHYSLSKISTSNYSLRTLMELAPKDSNFIRDWETAVSIYIKYVDENSPNIEKLKKKYPDTKLLSAKEKRTYYSLKYKYEDELKQKNPKKYNSIYNNFIDKLNRMWIYRGKYLLKHHKSNNLEVPVYWLNNNDLKGIEKNSEYKRLIKQLTLTSISCPNLTDFFKKNLYIKEKVHFSNSSDNLPLLIEGSALVKIEKQRLKVELIKGTIKINSKGALTDYKIGDLYLGLGKELKDEKHLWDLSNKSNKIELNKVLNISKAINIAGLKFTIPISNRDEVINKWIVVIVNDDKRKGHFFSSTENNVLQ